MGNLILFTLSTLAFLIHPLSLLEQNSFSISLDVNSTAGDQAVTSVNVSSDEVVAFSADSQSLAVADNIGMWPYDIVTAREIALLTGHTDEVNSASFSPDGKIFASGAADGTVKLWDVATNTTIATLKGHTDGIKSVSFSSNGKMLASETWDKTVKLWDVETGTNIATLEGHTDTVTSVSFSYDGKILASGSWDETVKLWDVETGTNIATLEGHNYRVRSISFSPDG